MKHSDEICDWLVELGYTHCFFVAGGNIMHLLNSARTRFKCIPVVHEVSAGIAAEYFNELDLGQNKKAFALVTAGPGLTNIVTAIASAQVESRALLILGGQVKSGDLSHGKLRQRGIQEIDGVALVKSITKAQKRITSPISKREFIEIANLSEEGRKGVVFVEVCLDAQGAELEKNFKKFDHIKEKKVLTASNHKVKKVAKLLQKAERPIILIGGGLSRADSKKIYTSLLNLRIPLMCTWNGADRIPDESELFWGRPNTWGMRYSNILIQQSDLLITIGTRLGIQQTGFDWKNFAPLAKIIQVDVDKKELSKGHPRTHLTIKADAANFIKKLIEQLKNKELTYESWIHFGDNIKSKIPLSDPSNTNFADHWNPYEFMQLLSKQLKPGDILIPSSSGGAETVTMQAAQLPSNTYIVTDKGMASMGYGLAGAIGAAIKSSSRIFHIEGDGGFAQNLQELGTVRVNNLPIKTFLFDNGGYASIRTTQKSYYEGQIIGCDIQSGLGLPNWIKLFNSFGITCKVIPPTNTLSAEIIGELEDDEPRAFLIPIHPDQTYFPKITSRVLPNGEMVSNPLHLMSPDLTDQEIETFLPFLKDRL